MINNIKMGNIVRDVLTGFNGTVIQIIEQLSGNIQYAIQRKQNEGETGYPEAMCIDYHTLEVISEGFTDRVQAPIEVDIPLGARVRDTASTLEGIVVERITYFNGCLRFGVIPKVKENQLLSSNSEMSYIDPARLEVIDDGIKKPIEAEKPTGGPAQKVTRPSVIR